MIHTLSNTHPVFIHDNSMIGQELATGSVPDEKAGAVHLSRKET